MGLLGGTRNTVDKFHEVRANASILGVVIPILFGQQRLSARLLDYNDFTVNKAKQQGGKGLAKGGSQYVYTASIIALLAQGPIHALLNLWDSTGRFVLLSSSETFTIPNGGGTFTPANAPIFGNDQGVFVAAAYTVGPFTDFGSPGPTTLTGTQNIPMLPVSGPPGGGQYGVNPITGVYTFAAADSGKVATINYSYYRYQIITQELTVVPFSGPFTVVVDNSTNYKIDQGVSYYPSGTAFVKVGGSPAVGQYSQSGATYTFNAADSGQGIVINYVYNDPNTNTNAPTTLNLTLVSGLLGQAPLSYMTGKHPSKALGYSQLAYIFSSGLFLGFSPALPNYSYEVAGTFQFGGGIADANPADCIIALLTDPAFGIPNFNSVFLGTLGQNVFTKYPLTAGMLINSGFSNFVAANFFDGDVTTLAFSNNTTNIGSTVAIDLGVGATAEFRKVRFYMTTAGQVQGYRFFYSDNGSSYTQADPGTFIPSAAGWNELNLASNGKHRYWLFQATATITEAGYCSEVEMYTLTPDNGARTCWAANSFFISPIIENQSACAHIIKEWLEAGMVGAFWSEARLKFVPYSDTTAVGNGVTYSPSTTPIVNITDDNYIIPKDKAEDPVTLTRSAWQDAYNRAQVSYHARVNDYNPEVIYEQDEASIGRFGLRVEDPQQWDFITTLAAAQYAASMRVQRKSYIRNEYSFKLPDTFSYLEPMDVITINDLVLGLAATPVRITKIEDDYNEGLNITAEDFIWGIAQPTFNPKLINSPYILELGQQDPGNTNALVFEAPNRLGLQKGNVLYGFVNGSNPNWGGCHVWVSSDGINYALLTTINTPGRLGQLTQTLPSFGGSNPDNTNTLQVKLNVAGTTLPAASASDASNLVSLCAIVNASNALELLSYQNSTLRGAELYNLTTLYRGAYGTSGSSHIIGEIFARLDEASFIETYDPSFYGKTLNFKFTSFNLLGNQEQSLSAVTAYPLAISGTGKGAVALDTGFLLIGAPGYTAYRPLSNALTAHDAGSNVTVFIASFTMQLAGLTNINYNSGSITGLSYNTLYFIYFDDPTESGGTVTYQATQVKETAFAGTTRFFIGSIMTPLQGNPDTTGNSDGGNSAQYGMLNTFFFPYVTFQPVLNQGNGTKSNETNIVDGLFQPSATYQVTGNSAINVTQTSTNPQSITMLRRSVSSKVRVMYDITTNSLNGAPGVDARFVIDLVYLSTSGGGNHNVIVNIFGGTTVGKTIAEVVIPAGVISVQINITAKSIVADTAGTLIAHVYEFWAEGIE
jgi:hypothetical protein